MTRLGQGDIGRCLWGFLGKFHFPNAGAAALSFVLFCLSGMWEVDLEQPPNDHTLALRRTASSVRRARADLQGGPGT